MVYPGYMLNPGDMFQVDPERVLFATGARKDVTQIREGRSIRKSRAKLGARQARQAAEAQSNNTESKATKEVKDGGIKLAQGQTSTKVTLQTLLSEAKEILGDKRTTDESAKRKQALRSFRALVQSTLSNKSKLNGPVDSTLLEMASKLSLGETKDKETTIESSTPGLRPMTRTLKSDEERMLKEALVEARDNPVDPSKPYKTPWEPRPYMSPFAFIPRYLEVHHTICSAVYLRHPVARAGMAEVPTPFNEELNGLAYNWYLRPRSM
jgi:ribosomal protein S4